MNSDRTVQELWMADESYYKLGDKVQRRNCGLLTIIEIRPVIDGLEVVVRREDDGWEGLYIWIPIGSVSALLYQLPVKQEIKDD